MAESLPQRHRSWPLIAFALALLAYAAFVALAWSLRAEAEDTGATAQREFGGDRIEALVALVQSTRHPLDERNRAVHALGQIGDPRAVSALERLYTGEPCEHARLLCQKELKKAIDRCSGRNWAPRWLPFLPPRPREMIRP